MAVVSRANDAYNVSHNPNVIFGNLHNYAKEEIQLSLIQANIRPFLQEIRRQHRDLKIRLLFRQRITTTKHAHTDADMLVVIDGWVMNQTECGHLSRSSYKIVARALNPRRDKLHQYSEETTLFRIHPNCTYSYLLWGGDETYYKPYYQQELKANNWIPFQAPNINHLNTHHLRATIRFLRQTITTAIEEHMFHKEVLAILVEAVVVDEYVEYYMHCDYEDENDECEHDYREDFPSPSQGFDQFVYPLPKHPTREAIIEQNIWEEYRRMRREELRQP